MCERDSADAKMSEEHVHTDIQQRAQSPPLALPPSVRPWFAHGHTLTLPPRASQAKSANGTNKGVASRPHRSRQSPHGVEDQVAHRELPLGRQRGDHAPEEGPDRPRQVHNLWGRDRSNSSDLRPRPLRR